MMTQEFISNIEADTYSLLKESFGSESISYPVDLNKVAKRCGLKIKFVTFKQDNVDGAFSRKKNEIYVNSSAPLSRKLFTIAHELGHYFLHSDIEQDIFLRSDRISSTGDKEKEQAANWFAAALLMPKKAFLDYWEWCSDLDIISEMFGVSYSAAYYRAKNLGLKING
ncbi:TPA: ImmA/IrrE family metallo-endopeptidase [Legionella pneumophila]|uniref:ImmA/IrrE family metallo-endopeptidase n=1 Tax=Legionella pneumophila TaxID=446 RepID=UPI001374B674|nr:ImmA/IrrE family metallo-endopeptidase [Legionella pneumophila]HAT8752896.1 ImmA/IrrE family metallo-endopeptidase [Legionella pneumophila]